MDHTGCNDDQTLVVCSHIVLLLDDKTYLWNQLGRNCKLKWKDQYNYFFVLFSYLFFTSNWWIYYTWPNGRLTKNVFKHISAKSNPNLNPKPNSNSESRAEPGEPALSIEMLFQAFKLNFSWDMPKVHYFITNFQKSPQRPLTFNFGELKLHNLTNLWIFKLIMTKSNSKKSIMTSF